MRINRKGATRIVIELTSVVIKIPNFLHTWQTFVRGLLSNIDENDTWLFNSGAYDEGRSKLLCPVEWCSWGGWILIMSKVDKVLTYDEFWEIYDKAADHIKYFPGDDTGPNYGFIDNRLVKIDYAQLNKS
jgi:hypothetical protein